jgi:hypothetical protein
MLSVIE